MHLAQTEKFTQIGNISSGTKMPRADWHHMKEIPFCVLPIKEQEKIARVLNTWDSYIDNLEKLIEAKQRYKKGLMQRLLIPPQEHSKSIIVMILFLVILRAISPKNLICSAILKY